MTNEYAAQLKETLEQSYQTVCEYFQSEAKRQKEIYSKKVHGKQFNQGDLVWLHSPVVPRGQSRNLHCPWIGPFKVSRMQFIGFKTPGLRGSALES